MFGLTRYALVSFVVFAIAVVFAEVASAQIKVPRPSPRASIMQTVGVTDVTITYFRPGVKGRKIWGDWPAEVKGEATLDNQNQRPEGAPIVPYGHVWRTGANDATQFIVTDDVLINGQPLPAGTYSLHTIPGRDEWTIVFNGTANQWGSFNYDPAKDVLRVKAKPVAAAEHREWMDFSLDPDKDNTLTAAIRWEKVRVPFTIEVKDVVATTLARARESVASAKSDDWQTPFQAANYAKANKSPEEAAKWYEKALSAINENLKTRENFQNLTRKVNILFNAGKTDEAIAVGEKAIAAGKAEKADTAALERRIAEAKAAKQ
ncbi:MAG TPA: DUF2911 domain-containing protein [Pyrinomonadaceae bacterium]|nr:DUF2911 domain-containing protein [Pyrinomonadaceae bacterium]